MRIGRMYRRSPSQARGDTRASDSSAVNSTGNYFDYASTTRFVELYVFSFVVLKAEKLFQRNGKR